MRQMTFLNVQLYSFFLFLLLIQNGKAQQPVRVTRNVEVTAEEEKVRDKYGYEAIKDIHSEMDDDRSGSIDRNESTGFMKEDMHMRGTERIRRENKFHGDDDAITVDDLWESWFESAERNWSNERLVEWLIELNLPTIADVVKTRNYDGKVLPRFATHSSEFLTKDLGIKSSVYRQKLRLNTLDVVLFGYRDNNSKLKDVALALLLLILTFLCFMFVRHKQFSQKKVDELSNKLNELKNMETEFEDVQKMLNDEKSKRSTSDGNVTQTEMENLRIQLEEAERRLEANTNGSGTPLALQPLLRRTCENEMAFLEKQRQDCFKEMKDAIEMVDRLQKKQGSVLSSLKLATGAASTSDQVDSKIFSLKNRMEKIHALTRETQERWMQIESLCGFPVLYINETEHMNQSNSSLHFYSNSGAASTSSGSIANAGIMNRSKISSSSQQAIRFKAVNTGRNFSSEGDNESHGSQTPPPSVQQPAVSSLERNEAAIAFQQNGTISDDSRSIQTTTSSQINGSESVKKKRSIFPKIFRKSTSKLSLGSMGSNNNVSIST